MNRISTISLALIIGVIAMSSVVTAAVPQIISYQGQLTDSTGAAVADGPYLIRFQIYDAPLNSDQSGQNQKGRGGLRR